MPKSNKVGGNKSRKGSKGKSKTMGKRGVTPWIGEKDTDLVYAQVKKNLGGYVEVECTDNITRRAKLRSRRIRICINDIVLLGINPLNVEEGFIEYKYNIDELTQLKSNVKDFKFDITATDSSTITFGDEDDINSSDLDEDEAEEEIEKVRNVPVRELATHEKRAKEKEQVQKKNSSRENKLSGESACASAVVDVDIDDI